MTEHDTFLKMICANPDDDTARLVFADWLAENGDPGRGEYIRVEVELFRRDADDEAAAARRQALFARRAELLKAHKQRWLEPSLGYARESGFERGFVQALEVPTREFLTHGRRWAAMTPLTRVRFRAADGVWDPIVGAYLWNPEELFASPLLSGLAVIDLERNRLTAADVELLARHPDLSRLRELRLGWNDVRNDGAAALAGSARLAGLESLDLVNNRISDAGARAIAQSPHLGGLKELRITRNPIRKRTWSLLEERFGFALM